jgi:hypothetical protein
MTPATIILGLFDWRGVMSRAAYRRNLSILVVLNLLIRRLDLLSGAAAFGWMALVTAIGLSLDARRYHDMGRSAAWIVWVNFIAAALAVAIFQLVPNVLGAIPLPEGWRVDAAGEAIIGRLIIPALVGAIGGNLVQSVWLASAPSAPAANPYAALEAAGQRAPRDGDGETLDEAALQAIIDRHLAMRQSETATPTAPSAGVGLNERPRQFGRRGR